MIKLILNLKNSFTLNAKNKIASEVLKMNQTIQRLNQTPNITFFRTDYLE